MSLPLNDRLWVPSDLVTAEHRAAFRYNVTDPYTREPYVVDTVVETPGALGFPRGNLPKVTQVFGAHEVNDTRVVNPHGYALRFTGQLRGEQPRLVREWLTAGYGQIMAPPRTGKCVVGDTLVQTDQGLQRIDSLDTTEQAPRVGGLSTAFHPSHWHQRPPAHVISVETTAGFQVTGTHEHPILVLDRELNVVWRPLADLREDDCIAIRGGALLWPPSEPRLPRPTKEHVREHTYRTPTMMTPGLAAVLGYIVAEGATTHHPAKISNKDPDLIAAFVAAFRATFDAEPKVSKDKRHLITIGRDSTFLGRFLYGVGLCPGGSRAQRVPWSILRATRESVRSFLRAYFDGDGWRSNGQIGVTSASIPLLRQVQLLLLNFGIFSVIRVSKKTTPKGLRRSYGRLQIFGENVVTFDRVVGFGLERKQKCTHQVVGRGRTIPHADVVLRDFVRQHSRPGGWYGDPPFQISLGPSAARGKYTGVTAQYLGDIADNVARVDPGLAQRFRFLASHPEIRWQPIRRVQRHRRRRPVFDLTVPVAESYQANGVIVHNTVVMTALMVKLRQRTIMLSHLEDLCHQFIDAVRNFTNIGDLEDQHQRRLAGVLDEWTDFFPIVTASTYQCFAVSAVGRRVLQEHRDDFGLVLIDEVHRSKTDLYTTVVSTLPAAYRCGVTATPERKDQLHCIVEDVIGPVVTVGQGEQLPIEWTWEFTGHDVKAFSNWAVMWNRLVKLKNRTKKIAKKVVEDVRAGHYVLVTTERLKHIDDLADAIQTIDPDITVGRLSGRTANREKFREDAKLGKFQVVVAMNKIVELGYNIPRWSSFHNTLPMTDPNNWYQRVSRIRTPFEPAFPGDRWTKPTPVARVWADQGHPAIYAYRAVVKKKMDALGFRCLTPEAPRARGRRKGLVSFE